MDTQSIALIATSVALVISSLAPIINSIAQRRHDTKIRRMELYEKHKLTAFNEFIGCYNKLYSKVNAQHYQEFADAAYKAAVYLDSKTCGELLALVHKTEESLEYMEESYPAASKRFKAATLKTFDAFVIILCEDISNGIISAHAQYRSAKKSGTVTKS